LDGSSSVRGDQNEGRRQVLEWLDDIAGTKQMTQKNAGDICLDYCKIENMLGRGTDE